MKYYKNNFLLILMFVFVLFFLLAGCSQNDTPTEEVIITSENSQIISEETNGDEEISDDDMTVEKEEKTKVSEFTTTPLPDKMTQVPTPDIRLNPEDWQTWPIIPSLSENARSILSNGIQMGNNINAFSKVGDCQSIKEVLLGIYDIPSRYSLRQGEGYLQETIDQFSGSFNRDGYAVKGGFNAATVLSPIWADPEICLPGENPLECEIRVHNPSMIIISLEVWWKGRTPERYEQYMRKIIEYSISEGVLPILSTKADNVEGDHSINLATAKLAYEYDIPLWNFWLAAQALPYQGIDPERDGFHITVSAWNERSYTALKTIDSLLRDFKFNGDGTSGHEIELTPKPNNSLSDPKIVFDHDFSQMITSDYGQVGKVLFELAINQQGEITPVGIYSLSYNEKLLSRIMEPGYSLFDTRSGKLLSGNENELVIADANGNILKTISVQLVNNAFWINNEMIVYSVLTDGLMLDVWVYNPEKDESFQVLKEISINSISKGPGNSIFYGIETDCNSTNKCNNQPFITQYDPVSGSSIIIGNVADPVGSFNDEWIAFLVPQENIENLFFQSVDRPENRQYIGLYGNVHLTQSWSPVDNKLAVIRMLRSDYFGKSNELLHYVITTNGWIAQEYPSMKGLNPQITWSPDGKAIITTATSIRDNPEEDAAYEIMIRVLNLTDGKIQEINESLNLKSNEFIVVTKLFWIE